MGYSEHDTLRMTLRKLYILWEDHERCNGTYQEKETMDDVIPF